MKFHHINARSYKWILQKILRIEFFTFCTAEFFDFRCKILQPKPKNAVDKKKISIYKRTVSFLSADRDNIVTHNVYFLFFNFFWLICSVTIAMWTRPVRNRFLDMEDEQKIPKKSLKTKPYVYFESFEWAEFDKKKFESNQLLCIFGGIFCRFDINCVLYFYESLLLRSTVNLNVEMEINICKY